MSEGAAPDGGAIVAASGPVAPVPDLGASQLVQVRKAKIEDAEAMALIMAAVAEEGLIGAEPPVDIEARAQRFRDAIEVEGRGASWVLEDAGRVVGNAGVHEQAPGVLYLGMAILPAARGRGGGRAFLQAIVEHARACGAHKLELEVWLDNARAIALYASAGFEVEGLRRNHYRRRDGRLRSALLMARLLLDDDSSQADRRSPMSPPAAPPEGSPD
jgi:RimJ/RimL family protein N-acetyltransferase